MAKRLLAKVLRQTSKEADFMEAAKKYEADKKANEVKEYCKHVDALIERRQLEIKALTTTPSSPLPAWCTAIDSTARNLIYYCTAVCACGITPGNGEKQEKHCFFLKKCVFFLASSQKSTYFCSVKKEKK